MLASGQYAELEARTEQFEKYFSVYSNRLGLIHNRIFEAAARGHLYGLKEGIAVLRTALIDAQSDDLVLPFAENSPHIIEMLRMIVKENPVNEYLNHEVYF